MSFDNSRFPFDPTRNYSGVVMEQGRVQLDSDWNEWLAELARRTQAGTLDTLGRAVYPATTPFAFQITASTDGSGTNHVSIGPGRMYVDGLLAENHGDPATAQWDPALAELSGSPQPPGAAPTGSIDYTAQPYLPNAALPGGIGPFLAYLDVWTRPITYLEDPSLIDPAVNVDTTGRLQTIWQVKLASVQAGATCASTPWPGPSLGQLTTGYVATTPSGPCCLTSNTGYTGMENQFYRVEIHQPGTPATSNAYPAAAGTATFKWSRDNASVETGVTGILTVTNVLGNPAAQLTVLSLGRDQVLGFAPGDWIEILDDDLELNGQPGELHLIDSVDFAAKTITLVDTLHTAASFPVDANNQTLPQRHTRIRRWDQSAKIFKSDNTLWVDLGAAGASGDIPVPPPGTTLILESGLTVTFGPNAATTFNTANFWTFAARTSQSPFDVLTNAPPRGIHHHYAPLSVVTFSPPAASNCRTEWPPAAEGSCGCCCTYTVGAGAQYQSIQAAINALPLTGGEICILPGRYFEPIFLNGLQDVVLHGCGAQTRLASPSLAPNAPAPAAPAAGSTTLSAVISIAYSQNIQLRDLVVEAAPGDIGILLDGAGNLIVTPPGNIMVSETAAKRLLRPANNAVFAADLNIGFEYFPEVVDVTVENLFVTASTMPAILSRRVEQVRIRENRIAMANVCSLFPAISLGGDQIEFVRNWVGLQTVEGLYDQFPAIVYQDLLSDAQNAANAQGSQMTNPFEVQGFTKHAGGVQIAGPSSQVLVAENTIAGGRRNGITLGSYTVLDGNAQDTGIVSGLTFTQDAACSTRGSLQSPITYPGVQGSTVVAGGLLSGIRIDRNAIGNTGLCGIGPVGFFNLLTTLEIIAVEDLSITGNTLSDTVLLTTVASGNSSIFGYGAICLPSVEGLIVRDNILTNFGAQPGLPVSGIFILHGEMLDISRNRVLDNRDWADASTPDQQGSPDSSTPAIEILFVTPSTFTSASKSIVSLLLYEPGLPALRLENNVVRVPIGMALGVLGMGPFAISNNHFSCGGNLAGDATSASRSVLILNLGLGIDFYFALLASRLYAQATAANPALKATPSFLSSSGAVLFTNNVCQLELQEVPQNGFASVEIITLDHLVFSNNHCWVDAGLFGVLVDAFLLADSLQVTGNRFQEGLFSVVASARTIGVYNITSQNISTYCLIVDGKYPLNNNNLMMFPGLDKDTCLRLFPQ